MNPDQKLLAEYAKINPWASMLPAPPMIAAAVRREQAREEADTRRRVLCIDEVAYDEPSGSKEELLKRMIVGLDLAFSGDVTIEAVVKIHHDRKQEIVSVKRVR